MTGQEAGAFDSPYQKLFDAISSTGGIPLQTDMQEIIAIVHRDFPLLPEEQPRDREPWHE